MYIVTGGAGFIGSNIIKALNNKGIKNILLVDDLTDGKKCLNLSDLDIADYMDMYDFLDAIKNDTLGINPIAVFHEGACSATTEWNGKYVMDVNYQYSKAVLDFCLKHEAAFSYASSASVYGSGPVFQESRENEKPLNMYAYSKFQFDQYIRAVLPKAKSQIVGFRYFNVYGPREQHKGSMASVAFHLNNQMNAGEDPKLFEGSDEFKRDFVYVGDVAAVNLWFLENGVSGIYNCGTGRAEPFRAVADAVIKHHGKGEVQSIPFPEHLKGAYQEFTQADLTKLRAAGCDVEFKSVADGVAEYMAIINK